MTASDRGSELPSRSPKQKSTYHLLKQFQTANESKEYSINHDALTGLYNQRFWLTEVDRLANSRNPLIVATLDLDGFKKINDTEGHAVGNQYLINTAKFLQSAFRPGDIIARIGGDEFAILLEIPRDFNRQELLDDVQDRLTKGQKALNFSFGLSQSNNGHDLKASIEESDKLMYDNKRQRKIIETSIEYT